MNGMTDKNRDFVPALGKSGSLDRYDAAIALMTREKRWRGDLVRLVAAQAGERVVDEAVVAPGAGPDVGGIEVVIVVGTSVGVRDGPGLLVANQRPVLLPVDGARLPTGLPVDLVAAPEQEVDARIAGFLDVVALVGGPVFVVPDRDEGLVFFEVLGPEPVGVGMILTSSTAWKPASARISGTQPLALGSVYSNPSSS